MPYFLFHYTDILLKRNYFSGSSFQKGILIVIPQRPVDTVFICSLDIHQTWWIF